MNNSKLRLFLQSDVKNCVQLDKRWVFLTESFQNDDKLEPILFSSDDFVLLTGNQCYIYY